ncbi:MAG: hypothetical protein OEZ65_13520 [Gemmatimonadota bacterium]|nr:hypothetical protein [Gemmatimonadota bacterium]MDH5760602.1 hypothetical protein [Gemmatimonadota bacterium]
MSTDLTAEADRRLDDALAASGARDPREFYRERLRELKQLDVDRYAEAVAYYRDTLIPTVAEGREDPLVAWTEYGRHLASLVAPGRTVEIDATGLAHPYAHPYDPARLVLHLPDQSGGRALLVGLPSELSAPQRATYDILVMGRQKSRNE